MWRDRVPLRGMTVLAGEKGLRKSICTNAMLPAALTRGNLDGELEGQPVDVLVASAEDDWRAVVKPRLMAHGADLDRVHRVAVEEENGDGMLTLPNDVARLEEAVTKLRAAGCPVGLLVIDPIRAFLTQSTDSHKDAHVRRALAPMAAMAERLDLAVIVVAHLTKDDSRRLISRVNGSGAFVNAARSVLGFVRDPDDQDGEQGRDRVLVHAASNWGRYAPSLAARVEPDWSQWTAARPLMSATWRSSARRPSALTTSSEAATTTTSPWGPRSSPSSLAANVRASTSRRLSRSG
jgi:AAA domain